MGGILPHWQDATARSKGVVLASGYTTGVGVPTKGKKRMWLQDSVIDEVSRAGVRVFYLDRGTAFNYNRRRKAGEPVVFTGHYWSKGRREGGPFKSKSAAFRDAFYIVVQHTTAPRISTEVPAPLPKPKPRGAARTANEARPSA